MVTTNRNASASTTLRYLVWIKGDVLTQKNMGNPYSRVWKRVSSEMPAKGPTDEVALRQAKTNSREITQTAWNWAFGKYINVGRYSDALRVVESVRNYLRQEGKTKSPEYVALTISLGVVLSNGLRPQTISV